MPQFLYPFIHFGHLGWFHILATVYNTAVIMEVQMSLGHVDFIVFGCVPSNGIAVSYISSVLKSLRNLHTILHNGCTKVHPHQQCSRVPFFTSLLTCVIFNLFNKNHSNRCELIAPCGLKFHFCGNCRCWIFFSYWPFVCLLFKSVYPHLLPILGDGAAWVLENGIYGLIYVRQVLYNGTKTPVLACPVFQLSSLFSCQ